MLKRGYILVVAVFNLLLLVGFNNVDEKTFLKTYINASANLSKLLDVTHKAAYTKL